MVSALDSGAGGPVSSAGRGHCAVFLGKTLYSHSASLSTQEYKWVPPNCWGKPNKLRGSDLRWTSILSRGSKNTSGRFMPGTETGISSGSYEPASLGSGSKTSLFMDNPISLQIC